MKTMIAAAAGTFLLVPSLIPSDGDPTELFYDVDRVPVLGWMNFGTSPNDIPGTRTGATPVVPYWPVGVSQAAGYQIPDDQGGYMICVPFAKRTFAARAQYDHFAEEVLRAMEEARDQEDSVSGEKGQSVEREAREDRDESGYVAVQLPGGQFAVTIAEDARPYGETISGKARRIKSEIEADETYVAAVESTGKTIRAANHAWKTTPSRCTVLAKLSGIKEALAAPVEDDDDDILG